MTGLTANTVVGAGGSHIPSAGATAVLAVRRVKPVNPSGRVAVVKGPHPGRVTMALYAIAVAAPRSQQTRSCLEVLCHGLTGKAQRSLVGDAINRNICWATASCFMKNMIQYMEIFTSSHLAINSRQNKPNPLNALFRGCCTHAGPTMMGPSRHT